MKDQLRAEWTKLRTLRAGLFGLPLAAALIILTGLMPGIQGSCGKQGPGSECTPLTGPEGQVVADSFSFLHQTLSGDGSLTVRVASLTGKIPDFTREGAERDGLVPWAKAGLIIKDGTRPGSTYAAIMVTGGHGIRMQHDFVHDTAGRQAQAGWLRLTRNGSEIVGEESADGTHWTVVGKVALAGLPATVQAGMFVTSPEYTEEADDSLLGKGAAGGFSEATATFADVTKTGGWAGEWQRDKVGGPSNMPGRVGGEGFTLTGTGDIAPSVGSTPNSLTQTLIGTFLGLTVVVVIGALFATGEYRRGMIRTTFAAQPRRGRVLAAKALVLGTATFISGLVAAAVVVLLGQRLLRANGVYVFPASTATELRLIVGTAALLAFSAVLGLALGFLLRRSATAITAAVVAIVLPYLLTMTVLPTVAGQWSLRVTPAAAFALQQSIPWYPQVDNLYTPVNGYFPLPPWAGFAVLAGWTVLGLALATVHLRRRDA